ncbi:MAG: protein-L-isoaspartate O-methyltransferase, partial [Acidimicrobiia bacterium]
MQLKPLPLILVPCLIVVGHFLTAGPQSEAERAYEVARNAMVQTQLSGRDIRNPRVLDAMRHLPRHRFVPEEFRRYAYSDT